MLLFLVSPQQWGLGASGDAPEEHHRTTSEPPRPPNKGSSGEDRRKAEQRSVVAELFPRAQGWELDTLSGLPAGEFAIWRALAEHGTSDMCRSCLQDRVGDVVALGTNGSGPLRNLRKRGLDVTNGRRRTGCPAHPGRTTWQALRDPMPQEDGASSRARYTADERTTCLRKLGNRDAFTGSSGVELELDHRVPCQRLRGAEPKVDVQDTDAVSATYMCLTRANNSLKREKCLACIATGRRPAFLDIAFWYEGSEIYDESVGCKGCGYAYPEQWRDHLAAGHAPAE